MARRREAIEELASRDWREMTIRRLTFAFDTGKYVVNTLHLLDCWVSHHAHEYFFDPNYGAPAERKSVAAETGGDAEPAQPEAPAGDTPSAREPRGDDAKIGVSAKLRRLAKELYIREVIRASGLFYADYYLDASPDVRAARLDPLLHYVRSGYSEGRDPNPYFDSDWYLDAYPDVVESGINPLFHYVRYGAREARDPGPWFSTSEYLDANPDVRKGKMNPLLHHLRFGVVEGREAPRSRVVIS